MSLNEKRFTSQDPTRIEDKETRGLFFKIIRYLETAVPLVFGFRFYTVTVDSASTGQVQHGLGAIPKDILLTSVNPSTVSVTFKYENFTNENIIFTTSGACTVRFLAGTYKES